MFHALLADVFALVFRPSESVHKCFMSEFSIHCSYVILGDIFPIDLQVQLFQGACLGSEGPRGLWCLMWSSNHSFLREYLYLCVCSQLWIAADMVCISLDQPVSLPLPTVLMLSFYPFLWRFCSSNFQVPFWENYSIFSYRFVMFVGGSKFQVFLHDYQETSECWTSLASLEQILLYNSFYILFILLIFC